jgi:hypothetical protein
MDDNVVVFPSAMNFFATTIVYFTTCTKKYGPHMANFVFQLDYYAFNVPIYGSYFILTMGLP